MLNMNKSNNFANSQRGVMLLEALVAILIFSIGILAIVGLQVNSIKLAGDSKYRSDAGLVANRLIGQMWLNNTSPNFAGDYSTGGAQYLIWKNSDVALTLPITGVSAPTVTIAQSSIPISGIAAASTASSTVTIDIYWTIPGETANGGTGHHYQTRTQITN
jgi:type IV pilus assembly protein PilV